MKKVLYVDTPFANEKGGDKNRSRFLWDTLNKEYDCDLFLVRSWRYIFSKVHEHNGYTNCYSMGTLMDTNLWETTAVYKFTGEQIKKWKNVLQSNKYDLIVFRFSSMAKLARIAEYVSPDSKIIIDVDMLFSRIAELSWNKSKILKNRYFFIEYLKLKAFERKFFSRPYYFLFSNAVEKNMVLKYAKRPELHYQILPNAIGSVNRDTFEPASGRYILFFGTLSSAANEDAFLNFVDNMYPVLKEWLIDNDIRVRVVGKEESKLYSNYKELENIDIIGEVDDIESEIHNAMSVLLPLRVASGTRTRILEAGMLKKAVMTTTIGIEGLELGESEVIIRDSAEEMCEEIMTLHAEPEKLNQIGERLYSKTMELYFSENVGKALVKFLDSVRSRKKIAILTNRFYPEVGGAETNIHYQAIELAKNNDVTVYCPQRIDREKTEIENGFIVKRLYDVFNPLVKLPNIKTKTLCPTIIWHLINERYDVIQCFPAISYNNMLAFIIGKLLNMPVILCSFDFLDYAGMIKATGKINPDVLSTYKVKHREKLFLHGYDHIFAIADKEIQFFKRFNPNVSYSPVPILLNEYEVDVDNIRKIKKISDDKFVFLSLGRVSEIKGQMIGLNAFIKIADKVPDSMYVFVGRSDYEPQLFEEMKRLVTENNLNERVIFTGMVDRWEVLSWLRHSDIHVIPVRFMNSGAVVVESWISGTPVIQSNVVDPNLVVEGKNGYLFDSENIDMCAEKMVKAYENKDNLSELASEGEKLVRQKYTYKYLTNLYEEVYEKVKMK